MEIIIINSHFHFRHNSQL